MRTFEVQLTKIRVYANKMFVIFCEEKFSHEFHKSVPQKFQSTIQQEIHAKENICDFQWFKGAQHC